MPLLRVCCMCSVMDVKMYDLRSHPLQGFYESAIGTNPFARIPPYACYECAALVKKFYFFKKKCIRNQNVLNKIVDIYGTIKRAEICEINRKELNLASTLTITHLDNIDTPCLVSETPFDEIGDSEELVKQEPEECVEDKVKIEDHTYATIKLLCKDFLSSDDDDEPLAIHKEKKILKDDESPPANMKFEEIFDNVKVEIYPEAVDDGNSADAVQVKRCKQKKQRSRKGAFNHMKIAPTPDVSTESMDVFDDYINVITLTLEEQKEEVMKRKETSNYLNSPYQCNLCYKGFIDANAWNHHVSKHAESAGNIICEVCKFRFKTKRAYQKHANCHEKRYACKSCPYVSSNITQAKQHQAWHQGVTFKCKFCGEIFSIWTSYMSHIRMKHPSEFICGICGYSYISKLGLNMHKTMMHKDFLEKPEENTDESIYCAECDVKFVSSEAFKRHMVMSVKHTQTTDSITGCRTCGAQFVDPEELRAHHRKEHPATATRRPKNYRKKPLNDNWPAKCEHCDEEIANARAYWGHFRRAHPDLPYPVEKNHVCDVCGKSFKGNAFLVYHKRTHSDERLYKCSQCDKAFFNRSNLLMHEKIHSSARPYPCNLCSRAFKCKAALSRHLRVHTGHKPYICEVCGKGFSQSNSRKLHVRTVHLKQPAPYISRSRLEKRKQADNKETTHYYLF